MKKNFLLMMAALGAATVFTSCSDDDDDNNGNGNGAGNGGSGVTVLSKKVSKIVSKNEDGKVSDTYFFSYDSEGKLSKIIDQYGTSEAEQNEKSITYSENKIVISKDTKESVIHLKDGKAVSYAEQDGSNWKYDYTFSYSGNYLSEMVSTESQLVNGVWTKGSTDTYTYTVKDGNLSAVKNVWKGEHENGTTDITVTYGKVANNANIDLGYLCYETEGEDLLMLCVLGNRYQNLPSSMSSQDEDGWSYRVTFTYETDKEGYVTKITIVSVESGEGQTYTDTDIYEIVYE